MESDRFDAGIKVRRQVLGDEYVSRALAGATDFNTDLQTLVTEFCWGSVWTRPGLPLKTRSLLNLAMMVAMNRPHELALHIKGARRNECSVEEIREVLLQAAVYAGIPAGVDAFRVAAQALEEFDAAESTTAAER